MTTRPATPPAPSETYSRPERLHVIANPAAGADRPVLATLNAAFHDAGITWDVSVTNDSGDAARFAREAAEAGIGLVVAYGGDGTVAEVVSGLEGTGVPVGILPGGTANVFANELGIPTDLAQAAALLTREARIRAVDVGVLGEERFLVRVGVGLEADTVEGATREEKDRLGVLAYPIAAIRSAGQAPVVRYRLQLDGREETAEGVTCVIANSGGLGRMGLRLAADIAVDDGLLDVLVLRSAQLGTALKAAATMATEAEPAPDVAAHWQAREIELDVEPPQTVVRDGELAGETPARLGILPGAARVVVPPA